MTSFLLFGLTGGIASGKSTVGRRWAARGIPVIDADVISRKVVENGSSGLREVITEFGNEFLNAEGGLERRKLGAVVFENPERMKMLESILSPKMDYEIANECARLRKDGHSIVCYEAATIVDRGNADKFRPIVVVHAPEDIRIRRMIKRDGFTEVQARMRLSAQASEYSLKDAADYLISSDGPKEATYITADDVLNRICRSHGIDPERFPVKE